MLEAHHLRAHHARRAHPGGDAHRDDDRLHVGAQEHHDEDDVKERGQRDDDVHDAHHHHVDLAAEVARDAAVEHADNHVDEGRHEADGQRNARAVEDAREDVAPELVRAAQVLQARALVHGGVVLMGVAVGREHRPEDRQQRHEHDHHHAEHGQRVLFIAQPDVLPVRDARTGERLRVALPAADGPVQGRV